MFYYTSRLPTTISRPTLINLTPDTTSTLATLQFYRGKMTSQYLKYMYVNTPIATQQHEIGNNCNSCFREVLIAQHCK